MTSEQDRLIRELLKAVCSDSQSYQRAYSELNEILTVLPEIDEPVIKNPNVSDWVSPPLSDSIKEEVKPSALADLMKNLADKKENK